MPEQLSPPEQRPKPDAEAIDVFLSGTDLESILSPEEIISDADYIDYFAANWLHDSIGSDMVADTIFSDTRHYSDDEVGDNAWRQRLRLIIKDSPFFDIYPDVEKDANLGQIIDFLEKTKGDTELMIERKAAMALGELGSVLLNQKRSTDNIVLVFHKLLSSIKN